MLVVTLRTVCKHWRSSITPPPLLRLSPDLPKTIYDFYSYHPLPYNILVPTAVYLLRPLRDNSAFSSASPWLVSVEQIYRKSRKLRLFHPLTEHPIKTLPDNFAKGLYNFHALEVSKGCKIRNNDGTTTTPQTQLKTDYFVVTNKVVYWPSPSRPVPQMVPDCNFMQLSNGKLTWNLRSTITYVENKCTRWAERVIIDDIVRWEGMILAVDSKGKVYRFEYDLLRMHSIADSAGPNLRRQRTRLLVFNDDLYLVMRHSKSRTISGFMVYKLIEQQMNQKMYPQLYSWEYVESLGDKVLFVSPDTCFCVQTTDLPGIPGNCIVFAEGDCGIGMCTYGKDSESKSCPGFSDVFWPPPKWIWELS